MVIIILENIDGAFLYAWVVLPVLIFFARVCDVSLGTIRIIFVSKGLKYLAPLIGFFEILIWLMAIGQILQNINNVFYFIFYAAGFAAGNFVGIILDEKLSIGSVGIRVITKKDATVFIDELRKAKFSVTAADAEGDKGPVKIIYSIIKRKNADLFIHIVKNHDPQALYSIQDIRQVCDIFPPIKSSLWRRSMVPSFRFIRKGK